MVRPAFRHDKVDLAPSGGLFGAVPPKTDGAEKKDAAGTST
jgi:hypothetical protein